MTMNPETGMHDVFASHWPLLGTVVEVRASAAQRSDAERAERIVGDEMARLEGVFSVFDEASMLRRWTVDGTVQTSNEFDELLEMALRWQRCSRGAFNVSTRRLRHLWAAAAIDDCRPSAGELQYAAADIVSAPYRFDGHVLQQVGDCSGLDLNAIAKGYIVDLAVEAAWRVCSLDSLTVSAGGDIAHRGSRPVSVGIEDPASPLDNAAPLLTIDLHNAAVATSGSARRGVTVGTERLSHVLDPRTGEPAAGSTSVTVVAPDAATADVVATIVNVMQPEEGLAFVGALNSDRTRGHPAESFDDLHAGPISCWIVDQAGERVRRW